MVAAGDIRPLYHAEGRRTLSRRTEDPDGDVAQLVERLLCKQDVRGSSPLVSILRESPPCGLSRLRALRRLSPELACRPTSRTMASISNISRLAPVGYDRLPDAADSIARLLDSLRWAFAWASSSFAFFSTAVMASAPAKNRNGG